MRLHTLHLLILRKQRPKPGWRPRRDAPCWRKRHRTRRLPQREGWQKLLVVVPVAAVTRDELAGDNPHPKQKPQCHRRTNDTNSGRGLLPHNKHVRAHVHHTAVDARDGVLAKETPRAHSKNRSQPLTKMLEPVDAKGRGVPCQNDDMNHDRLWRGGTLSE